MAFEHLRRYQAKPTNRVMPVGMNYLSELVVRPGMRKRLWPLCLYRGNMSPGHAHRLWNFSLLMMAAEAETLGDGIKLSHNPAFAQLCGPVRVPTKLTLWSYFGRLGSSPDVTDNIPGFTEYVRSMQLGPCTLTPVNLETDHQFCAPWRISTHPDFDPQAERPESGIRNLFYPYIAHDPKREDDRELALLVNKLVPAWVPEQIRADACQDLIVSLLSGEISAANAPDWVAKYVQRVWKMHPTKWDEAGWLTSLDQPIGKTAADGGDGIAWRERV